MIILALMTLIFHSILGKTYNYSKNNGNYFKTLNVAIFIGEQLLEYQFCLCDSPSETWTALGLIGTYSLRRIVFEIFVLCVQL